MLGAITRQSQELGRYAQWHDATHYVFRGNERSGRDVKDIHSSLLSTEEPRSFARFLKISVFNARRAQLYVKKPTKLSTRNTLTFDERYPETHCYWPLWLERLSCRSTVDTARLTAREIKLKALTDALRRSSTGCSGGKFDGSVASRRNYNKNVDGKKYWSALAVQTKGRIVPALWKSRGFDCRK